jgi:predicted Zn-dependent protease
MHRCLRRLVLLPIALAFAGCATNPVTGKRELALVSEQQEISMGLDAAKAATEEMGAYPDAALQEYVTGIGMAMAKASERPTLPWSFTVIDDPVVNAFALPGGPVFITRGILGYMNSEAQMASVLGHEIGHITARHSVRQLSRAQLAQIGLIGAMIARPDLQGLGDLGSQGLGLLFLRFGRDDETQADMLGFQYMTRQRYDPEEMAEMFRTLDRTSGDERRTPQWLSTHPDPGNRVARTEERIAAWQRPAEPIVVNREPFLRRLDGLVFGDDPQQGFFRQEVFFHPSMKFRLDFPAGWKTQNARTQVAGVSMAEDAVIVLTLAGKEGPAAAARAFAAQQGVQATGTTTDRVNGLPAATVQFLAQTEQAVLAGYATFVELDGTTYRVLAYTSRDRIGTYDAAFRRTLGSFQRVTDPEVLNVKPRRIRLVELRERMTLAEFQERYPSVIPVEQVAIINGAASPSASFGAGTTLKRVVAQ